MKWSYSRYSLFTQCPLKYKFRYIDKIPEESSYALERGKKIHTLAEEYVLGRIKGIPLELKKFSSAFRNIRSLSAKTELDLSVDKDWNPSHAEDSGVWCRGFADAVVRDSNGIVSVIDYKTGRVYDSHKEQMDLYAVLSFSHYSKIKNVHAELWYLDSGEVQSYTYSRSSLTLRKSKWTKRAKLLEEEKIFKPTPGYYCKYCTFKCKYSGK